jgi:hypothetical protein
LLDLLCDSYNQHYSTERKKRDLLERMCRHRDKVIRWAILPSVRFMTVGHC